MKNIEKIRAMTEDELAELIYDCDMRCRDAACKESERYAMCTNDDNLSCVNETNCLECIKKWLDREESK